MKGANTFEPTSGTGRGMYGNSTMDFNQANLGSQYA